MTEMDALKLILANLEFALEPIQLFVLRLINVTMLEFVILRTEFAVILQKIMAQIAMMEMHAPGRYLSTLGYALDLIILFAVFSINVIMLEFVILQVESVIIQRKLMALLGRWKHVPRDDSCQVGTCTGSDPIICTASDQCHIAGVCDSSNGVCSNPVKDDSAACDDGNACTQTDTCQSGICTGSDHIICSILDQCHNAGVCDPSNGICDNPEKDNTTSCDDGNGCTQTDLCYNGICTGTNPIICTASDQCHNAGSWDPSSGICSNPAKNNGATCDDGNTCTQIDTCQSGACIGSDPVICTVLDQCHNLGSCDPSTGICNNPTKIDGSVCDDGNGCTQTDSCSSGICNGSNPIICTAFDQCHGVGSCDPSNGVCSNPILSDGSNCNDGNQCSLVDSCQSGVCIGSNPVTCSAQDQCHDVGYCQPDTGVCTQPQKVDGFGCILNDDCATAAQCSNGQCIETGSVTCAAPDQCHEDGICNSTTGHAHINPRQMDFLAMMEMLVRKMILVNLEFVLDPIRLFVIYLINVTMLELAIQQVEFAVIQQRIMEQLAMMETLAHNKTIAYLEPALDLISYLYCLGSMSRCWNM